MHSVASVMPMTRLFRTSGRNGVDGGVEVQGVEVQGAGGVDSDGAEVKVGGIEVDLEDDEPDQVFVEGKSMMWDLSHLEED